MFTKSTYIIVTSTDDNDSEYQDEEMESQHNHSAYSLVLVEDASSEDEEKGEKPLKNATPKASKSKERLDSPQCVEEEENQNISNNSNEADDTITNSCSPARPTISPEHLTTTKQASVSPRGTPRSISTSNSTNSTPRGIGRRGGPGGCYSFRALPQTPSGTPRGMRAYIRSHTFPKGSKRDDEEELAEYWDQVNKICQSAVRYHSQNVDIILK